MTATVISLSSRVRNPEPTCNCPQHQLWALSDRVSEALAAGQGELLIDAQRQARVLEDVLETIAATVSTRAEAQR